MRESRLLGADLVRATACLMVLVHHLVQRLDLNTLPEWLWPAYGFGLMGSFGVASFFILSGFLLARPFWQALDAGEPMPSLRVYGVRRAARIVPGFWLALTATFVLSLVVFDVPLTQLLVTRYLAGLFLVSEWHWSTLFPVEYNGPLWSIAFEVSSYIFLPICLALLFWVRPAGVWGRRLIWVAIIGLVLLIHWLIVRFLPIDRSMSGWEYGLVGGANTWVPRFNPVGFFAIFAIGALAAGVQVRIARLRSPALDLAAVLGVAIAIWSMLSYEFGNSEGTGPAGIPYGFPVFPLGVALILVALPSSWLLGRLAENRPTMFIARISFGVYLWHYLIIELIRQLAVPEFAQRNVESVPLWLALSAVVFLLSVAVTSASFYWLERPVMRWARGLEQPRPIVAASLTEPSSLHRS